jgi:hypothetical protein
MRSPTKAFVPALIALAIALGSGRCGGSAGESATPCTSTADCTATGAVCAGGQCTACQVDAQCAADYGAGATCVEGACHAAACPEGSVGCPCKAGATCDAGECLDGACVDCVRGAVGCVCFDNGTCDAGARCGAANTCEACPAGEQGCPCGDGDACDGALLCQNGVCAVDPCPAGTSGCPCDASDACQDDLRCGDDGQCAPCTNDLPGCPCDEGTCTNHLVCDDADDTCREPVTCADAGCASHQACEQAEGHDAACLAACDPGYAWNAGTGACDALPEANCQEGTAGSILAECEAAHRACVETGDGAECGACLAGFTDDGRGRGGCRAVATCQGLGCADQHRACTPEGEHADATCGACLDGFVDTDGACVEVPEPTCEPGLPGSIATDCAQQHRACVPAEGDAPAHCGDCLEGFAQTDFGDCVPEATCESLGCAAQNRQCLGTDPFRFCGGCLEGTIPSRADPDVCAPPATCLTVTCPAGQYCIDGGPVQNATCIDAKCATGQAWSENASTGAGTCIDCTVSCGDDAGETGRIWLYTLAGGLGGSSCICETMAGYYWDDGERRPKPCDADHDGWTRVAARDYVDSSDRTLAQNARCGVRAIDRFTLRNEYRQQLDVRLCADGTLQAAYDGSAPCATRTVPLYESVRNDDRDRLNQETQTLAPAYAFDTNGATMGRRLRAEEVNALTRACTVSGDYNDNEVSDLAEWHGLPDLEGDAALFAEFSYFVELANGYYADNAAPGPGRWVIEERARCGSVPAHEAIPFAYPDDEGAYWRQCTRSRDATFDPTDGPDTPDFGMDFARWSCPAAKGGCPIPPPPTDDPPVPGVQPENGLCQVALPPLDGECLQEGTPWACVDGAVWRGLSHHSQFRCVHVDDEASAEEPRLAPPDFVEEWHLNRCRVVCPESDPACAQDCSGTTCAASSGTGSVAAANPWYPVLQCERVEAPQPGAVGFALARHRDLPPPYVRGCVNEWAPDTIVGPGNGTLDPVVAAWRGRCPGWTADPEGTLGQGDPNDFGRLQCGCGTNYGGPSCDLGCPTAELHTNPGYQATPRAGWWMCGHFNATAYPEPDPVLGPALVGPDGAGSTWVLRGEVPLNPTEARPLCQAADHCQCAPGGTCTHSGYVVR